MQLSICNHTQFCHLKFTLTLFFPIFPFSAEIPNIKSPPPTFANEYTSARNSFLSLSELIRNVCLYSIVFPFDTRFLWINFYLFAAMGTDTDSLRFINPLNRPIKTDCACAFRAFFAIHQLIAAFKEEIIKVVAIHFIRALSEGITMLLN